MSTLLVGGGREYADAETVAATLDEAISRLEAPVKIVTTDERGAADLTLAYARERNIAVVAYTITDPTADAQRMIDTFRPDAAVVFPGDIRTADLLRRLFYARVDTWVCGE